MTIRQIRHRPDNGDQFLVELSEGNVAKAKGPLNLDQKPTPEDVLAIIQGELEPDPPALEKLRDTAVPAKTDYELTDQGHLLDMRRSAPTPLPVETQEPASDLAKGAVQRRPSKRRPSRKADR